MVVNLTHSQIILRYKENGGRIEPYTIVIMVEDFDPLLMKTTQGCCGIYPKHLRKLFYPSHLLFAKYNL
jgi:hypothetical protein